MAKRFKISPLQGKEIAPYTENIWGRVTSSYFSSLLSNKKAVEIINVSDEFLRSKGGIRALEAYVKLLYDSSVQANMNKLVQEITSRDLLVTPASEEEQDIKVAQEVERQLNNINSDELFRKMAEAYVVGFSPGEIMWRKRRDNNVIEVREVRMRDPRRFVWATNSKQKGGFELRLLTKEESFHGIKIPPRKIIPFRYWVSNNGDPYGAGIGRILYFLVKVKRRALESEVLYTDRYATPTAVAMAPLSATQEEVNKVYDLISNLSQETGIILPEGFDISFVNPAGSPDTFQNIRDFLNREIAMLIAGEDEAGSSDAGSRASSEVALDVRERKARELSELICRCLEETLVKWIVEVNFGMGVEVPHIKRKFIEKEKSPLTANDLGTLMDKLNVLPTMTWVEEHFGIDLERDKDGEIVSTAKSEEDLANSFFGPSEEGAAPPEEEEAV